MFTSFNSLLGIIDDLVWGLPLIILILAVGIFLTIRLRGVQFTNLARAFRYIKKNEISGNTGEVSSFGALCTALSATIGTGNIVGVATAIVAGGPGALFWMWLAALLGTATKYAECLLAVKYRKVNEAKKNGDNLSFTSKELQIFEDAAYVMARHATPDIEQQTADDWLDSFNMFSIYEVLPHLLELWGLNQKTTSTAKKK